MIQSLLRVGVVCMFVHCVCVICMFVCVCVCVCVCVPGHVSAHMNICLYAHMLSKAAKQIYILCNCELENSMSTPSCTTGTTLPPHTLYKCNSCGCQFLICHQLSCQYLFLLRSPALGSTILGEIFAYVTVF